jgi:urease accessory protein
LNAVRRVTSHADANAPWRAVLTLPFERRVKSRQRAVLDDGGEVHLDLPRGGVLRDGDRLRAEDGLVIVVRAAAEPLSRATSDEPLALARASYHLGNRHVPVQIEAGAVAYPADHVLDAMVRQLGLSVTACTGPFEPEGGAYGHHHHE